MGSGLRAALSLSGGGGRRLRLPDQSDDYHGSAPHRQYRGPLKCPSGAVLRDSGWSFGSGGGRSGGGTHNRVESALTGTPSHTTMLNQC